MHLFFSVGEPSGDQHAAQLIHELKRRRPDVRLSGFGGPLMTQAGCRLLYELTNMAVMGLVAVLPLLRRFHRLVAQADTFFRQDRPDAVILVDFPGFNWWIARKAKAAGIPVFYYLPPQLWAWGAWRVRRMRRFVDHVLCALPFEKPWYARRGIQAEYVGHPICDEVAGRPLDADFRVAWQADPGPIVGLLPGSRHGEVRGNWPIMLEVVRRVHAACPAARFLVAAYKEDFRQWCQAQLRPDDRRLPLHLCVGKTPEIIELADCCLMVSGSVSLEMLARATPAIAMYRTNWKLNLFAKLFLTCKYMSLPNLIANREIMPEFYCVGDPERDVQRMTGVLHGWLSDKHKLDAVRQEMADLRRAVLQPGAIRDAAEAVLKRLEPAVTRAA